MRSSFVVVRCLLLVAILPSGSNCQDITDVDFPYGETLDDNYELRWNFNSTHIAFEVRVRTNGYVGFGISGSGSMFPSDVIIGWVRDGQVYFADRHADSYMIPERDDSQDWYLIDGTEDGDYTTLSMVRELNTCDDQDMPITEGTTQVIYSYHPRDPRTERRIPYHGPTRRGNRPIQLLNPPVHSRPPRPLPSDATSLEFLNRNYSVPGVDTMYSCTTWRLHDLGGKHHVIRIEPVIQEGHELLVHHMILYFCALPLADDLVGIQYECYDTGTQTPPTAFRDCQNVFFVWAIGSGPIELPDNVGIPLGTDLDPTYFRLEIHYDNPAMRTDFVDSSGMRLILTREIRPNDAGIMQLGIQVSEFPIVPPFQDLFLTRGYCQEECIEEGMGDLDEIYLFGNLLHSHLMGRRLRTRIIRNGTELEPLQENNHYDFNFQQYQFFEERTLRKGDSFIVECEYDSSDRLVPSWGGLSTHSEMCLSFVLYYPRIPLTTCVSKTYYEVPANMTQQQFWGYIHFLNWTDPMVQSGFRIGLDEAPICNQCLGSGIEFDKWYNLEEELMFRSIKSFDISYEMEVYISFNFTAPYNDRLQSKFDIPLSSIRDKLKLTV